ncbi:helix-turn-helix transcriptional regulator [Pyrococcus yayanosii]|uniref:Sugar-specific transcriptional regulator TrmB family n=1 Tax=Pyrococcus yayanosii (strain CH1 / JCM 16557) TaxID=529709 RepID=F8AF35_PYRYC|nr:MarR family transcriptional regulator [Pyrococcus yayanosii]AEH24880.1 Sugar-specific transcriptional regulator TrmB family [Pyrococcus yayanosii CH1]
MKKGVLLFLLLIFLTPVQAYSLKSVTITVYRDGYANIYEVIVPSPGESRIEVPLPVENFTGLSVLVDGKETSYILNGSRIVVYTWNASRVEVMYYTPDITSKAGAKWAVRVSFEAPVTVILPERSVIVGLSGIPMKIENNSITMPPGNQTIYYLLEFQKPSQPAPIENKSMSWQLILAVLVVVTFGAIFSLKFLRGEGKSNKARLKSLDELVKAFNLNEDEKRALMFIYDHGGKVRQADVRNALGIPRTTAWRMFKRLEKMGLVKISKVNNENWVELNFEITKENQQ